MPGEGRTQPDVRLAVIIVSALIGAVVETFKSSTPGIGVDSCQQPAYDRRVRTFSAIVAST